MTKKIIRQIFSKFLRGKLAKLFSIFNGFGFHADYKNLRPESEYYPLKFVSEGPTL